MELGAAQAREQVAEAARRLYERRLVVATSGNVSVRIGDGGLLAVTPSGVPYARMMASDVALVRLVDGAQVDGAWTPTSELPLHRAIYTARPDVMAVVHTHSLYATMLGITGRPLKPVHYAYGLLGDPVRTAPYVRYGTSALANEAVAGLGANGAVLLQNHGAVTVGADLEGAFERAEILEWLAALQMGAEAFGPSLVLSDAQMAEARVALAGYGPERRSE